VVVERDLSNHSCEESFLRYAVLVFLSQKLAHRIIRTSSKLSSMTWAKCLGCAICTVDISTMSLSC